MAAPAAFPDWPAGMPLSFAAAYVGLSESALLAADTPASVWLAKGRKVWRRCDPFLVLHFNELLVECEILSPMHGRRHLWPGLWGEADAPGIWSAIMGLTSAASSEVHPARRSPTAAHA